MLRSSRSPPAVASSGLADRSAGVVGQLLDTPEEADANALRAELGRLAADRRLEQTEQAGDLVVRAGPVLATEGVQRHDRDAAADGVAEERPDGLDAGRVTIELRQVAEARPAAVAVHDDGDVPWQLVRWEERSLAGGAGRAGTALRVDGRVMRRGGRVGRSGEMCGAGH